MLFENSSKECSLDGKGRVRLPSSIMEQLSDSEATSFVMKQAPVKVSQNREKSRILKIYPMSVWADKVERLKAIDMEIASNEEYVRRQMLGAEKVDLDSSGRIPIRKHFIRSQGLQDSVMVVAYMDRIEIWNIDLYYDYLDDTSYDDEGESKRIWGGTSNVEE